jgi:N-acetylmuramoyl-L-alanine amidase
MNYQLIQMPSPNQDARGATPIDMLVLHYTGMASAEAALARLCDPASKVSAHYTITETGNVYAHVPEDRRAWHAGLSFWAGVRNVNACSIGIELVNPGHEFGYRAFPAAQIAALKNLGREILARHPIPASRVLGHSDVAPARKEDPGELFPWEELAASGIGLWPGPAQSVLGADDLPRFGYDPDVPLDKTITAFQRHFRAQRLTGEWDQECGLKLASLLASLLVSLLAKPPFLTL